MSEISQRHNLNDYLSQSSQGDSQLFMRSLDGQLQAAEDKFSRRMV